MRKCVIISCIFFFILKGAVFADDLEYLVSSTAPIKESLNIHNYIDLSGQSYEIDESYFIISAKDIEVNLNNTSLYRLFELRHLPSYSLILPFDWTYNLNDDCILFLDPGDGYDIHSNIKRLTPDSVTIQVEVKSVDSINASKLVSWMMNKQDPVVAVNSYDITYSSLMPSSDYVFSIVDVSASRILDQVSFKTFSGEKGIHFHYFVDVREPESGLANITILGFQKGIKSASLSNRRAYTNQNQIRFDSRSFEIETRGEYKLTGVNLDLDLTFDEYASPFYIFYTSDKSYLFANNQSIQGILRDNYFMASLEQTLILPPANTYGDLNVSIVADPKWMTASGFPKADVENLYLHRKKDYDLPCEVIFAYDPQYFETSIKELHGARVTGIVEKTVEDDYMHAIMEGFNQLCEFWGGSDPYPYTLMVVKDDYPITIGESSRGQGISSFNPAGPLIFHQMFHRWNNWDMGTRMIGEDWNGFWSEGFNEYYIYKTMKAIEPFYTGTDADEQIRIIYSDYRRIIGTNMDAPILENKTKAVYYKGGVIAYELDQELQRLTDKEYSLDDVLKLAWGRWKEENHLWSYDEMYRYLYEVTGGQIEPWWQKYIIDNEPIFIEAFEHAA